MLILNQSLLIKHPVTLNIQVCYLWHQRSIEIFRSHIFWLWYISFFGVPSSCRPTSHQEKRYLNQTWRNILYSLSKTSYKKDPNSSSQAESRSWSLQGFRNTMKESKNKLSTDMTLEGCCSKCVWLSGWYWLVARHTCGQSPHSPDTIKPDIELGSTHSPLNTAQEVTPSPACCSCSVKMTPGADQRNPLHSNTVLLFQIRILFSIFTMVKG